MSADDRPQGRVLSRREALALLGAAGSSLFVPAPGRAQVTPPGVAGCVVTADLVRGIRAYNTVMTVEIERRHGTGVLDRLRQEAEGERLPDLRER